MGSFFALAPFSSLATGNASVSWDPSTDPAVVGYTVYYGGGTGLYTNTVGAGASTSAVVSNLTEGAAYFFAAVSYDSFGIESDFSTEVAYTVPAKLTNQPPTIDAIASRTINENASLQTVSLTGLGSGAANENQTLTITASSSNPGLIPSPAVNYSSPSATGSLTFTPVAFGFGSSTITVTVNDGGASNNITTRSFTVTVNSVNQTPTLNALANITVSENASLQTVNLGGISSGATNETQSLTVTASSSNPGLVPNPSVTYTSPTSTGSLSFTPVALGFGSANITVTVNDGGASNNIVTRTFTVTVAPVNQTPTLAALSNMTISESGPQQIVSLSGISSGATNENQTLTVTASSSNPGLIPSPAVTYTSPSATGSLTFTPVAFGFGSSTITVTVNDGGASNNITTRSFIVTVNSVNQTPTLNTLANMTVNENASLQTVNLGGISSGATNEAQSLTVTASSSNPGLVPNPSVTYTSPSTSGSISFTPVALGIGTADITVTVNDGGASNNIITRTFTVTVAPVNQTPTLAALSNMTINENAPQQIVNLSGISSGATNENQTLTVTASSSNTGLIPNPSVTYTSPNATGSIAFTPAAFGSGTATITVTVDDGAASNNIVSRTFTVTVNGVNQAPTIDPVANVTINENAAVQTVNLTGITSGATNENQTLTVTASSSNTGLIPNPTVSYTSPNSSGSVSFTPAFLASGSSTITLTVNDGGVSNNITTRTFTVTVAPVNQTPTLNTLANMTINENAGQQTVNLSGISSGATNENQTLTVTATSGNTGLIPNPTVTYTTPGATGSIKFTPVASAFGTASITVTVNDGGTSNNIISRSFTVVVSNQPPAVAAITNQVIPVSTSTGPIAVSLSDPDTATASLTLSGSSDNTALVTNPSIVFNGSGANRTVTVTPVAGQTGTAHITVTVNDGNSSTSTAFAVTVRARPAAPANLTVTQAN